MIGNVEYRVIQEINEGTNSPDVDLTLSCISLAKSSINVGEYPFAAVIARNGSFFCESINKVRRNHDVNRHAEIAAISKTQTVRGANLSDCTIYSTIEPCAQCSYVIRETQIGRVVYGPKSPLMGGPSRWNILSDTDLSSMLPEVLLPAPEIVSGFLQNEVEALFSAVESSDLARYQSERDFSSATLVQATPDRLPRWIHGQTDKLAQNTPD